MKPEAERVGTVTKPIAWLIAVLLPVAAVTATTVPWKSGFSLTYVAMASALQMLIRTKSPEFDRFAHILVLAGSAPFAVRFYFGADLATVGVVHVGAILAISIGMGYLLADRLRQLVWNSSAI